MQNTCRLLFIPQKQGEIYPLHDWNFCGFRMETISCFEDYNVSLHDFQISVQCPGCVNGLEDGH